MDDKIEFEVDDEVKVIGRGDDIFIVMTKFEQMFISPYNKQFHIWYSLIHKEKGWKTEAAGSNLIKISFDVNKILDEYNCLMFMENIFQNGKIKLEADRLLQKTKYGSRR